MLCYKNAAIVMTHRDGQEADSKHLYPTHVSQSGQINDRNFASKVFNMSNVSSARQEVTHFGEAAGREKIKVVSVWEDTSHYCRETLIHSIRELILTGLPLWHYYSNPTIQFLLVTTGSTTLDLPTIAALSAKFPEFPFVVEGDRVFISMPFAFGTSAADNLHSLSFKLFILQHPEIMKLLLENCEEITQVYSYLADNFLTREWGNSSNPSIAMSVFAYLLARRLSVSTNSSFWENGPCNAVQSAICPLHLTEYIRDVFLPLKVVADGLGDTTSRFELGFQLLVSLMKERQ